MTFFLEHVANNNSKLVLSVEQQSAGVSLSSLLNFTLKIALVYRQFTQASLWVTLYALSDLRKEESLSRKSQLRIQRS